MSDLWSGQITFTGIGSGTDFNAVVEQLMEVESYRLDQMESWKTGWEDKQEALSDLNASMITLQTTLEGMDTVGEFLVKDAESSDTSAVSVSADSDAEEGSHTVVVNQLAQNDVWVDYASGYDARDSVLTASDATMTLTYAGETVTIDIPGGTTLEGLVNIINNDPDFAGDVRSSVISDGDSHYLQIRGMDLGADNTLSVDSCTIAELAPANFTRLQAAQDCQVKVDDFPPGAGNWIELDTNVVEDVVDGLTFTLKDTTDASGARVNVTTDDDAVVDNVQAFVAAMNTVLEKLNDLTEYDADEDTGSILTGNYGVEMVESNIKSILATAGPGFEFYDDDTGAGDLYSSLSQVGIYTDADDSSPTFGLLLVDEEELREALDQDPDGVADLFAADNDLKTRSSDFTPISVIDGVTSAGTYEVEYEITGGVVTSATIGGHECSIDGSVLTALDGDARGLAIRVDDHAEGTHQGDVSVRLGKAGELVDALDVMTDPEEGTLTIIDDNYQNIVDNLDTKIAEEEARLERKQQTLTEKYARLEATLIYYEGVSAQLESSLSQLE